MSECKPNLPELEDLPKASDNKTAIDIDPPSLPSLPNLPGPLPLLKYFHINVYDILMLLFILWRFFKTGKKSGDAGAVEAPEDFNEFLEYVNSMNSTYTDITSAYDTDIAVQQTFPIGISQEITVRTPLVYPEDKVSRFQAIYNAYDLNDEFEYSDKTRQLAIMNLMFSVQDDQGLVEEYLELKKTQFTTASPMKRI